MSETQLERSVLEAKERDELFAIADALGAKPGARAKKADLVTQILRATGIEPDDGADPVEKPRRTRARRTTLEATPDAGATGPTPSRPRRHRPSRHHRLGRVPPGRSRPSAPARPAPGAIRGAGPRRRRGPPTQRRPTREGRELGPGLARLGPRSPRREPAARPIPSIGSEPPVLAGPVAGAAASGPDQRPASGRPIGVPCDHGRAPRSRERPGPRAWTQTRRQRRPGGPVRTAAPPTPSRNGTARRPTGSPTAAARRPCAVGDRARTGPDRLTPSDGHLRTDSSGRRRRSQWADRFRRSYPGVRRRTRQPEKPPTPGPGALRAGRPGPAGAGR